jgi:hypothetical protein
MAALPLAAAMLMASAFGATYTSYTDMNCESGHGAIVIDTRNETTKTIPGCQTFCDAGPACHCIVMSAEATATTPGKCWRRAACEPEACASQEGFNTFVKPGGPPVPTPRPQPPLKCSKAAGLVKACIFNPKNVLRSTDLTSADPEGAFPEAVCCAACENESACTAWSVVAGFGRFACNLYSGDGTEGEMRVGGCTSAGKLPPPPPSYPTPPQPPQAGPVCKDCPNILLMFTDDQDLVLGGWDSEGASPMKNTQARIGARGASATEWRIATPICAPSRSEMQ